MKDEIMTTSTTSYSSQIQAYDNMRPNNYPIIPPPNLQPFYTSTTQHNSTQQSGYSSLSPSEMPPPPYTMSQINYQAQETNMMENRFQSFYEFGNGMGTSFLEQIERGRMQSHMMNQI